MNFRVQVSLHIYQFMDIILLSEVIYGIILYMLSVAESLIAYEDCVAFHLI